MRFFALLPLLAAACATSLRPIPESWRSVPEATRITDLCAHVTCAEKAHSSEVRVDGGRLMAGAKALTPAFAAIQSFDVSLERREVVFSAKRADNFDIGLVSVDGSDIHWFPSERADETDVQWAPRGNKVSYIVHTARGDIVRTVHVPSSAQLSVEFAGDVDALAWEPAAERYAVVVESPEASQRIEVAKYGGEERRVVVAPAARLDIVTEPIGSALVLRPSAMRYNEKLPLVVWLDAHPLRWSDPRAALMRQARVAVAVVTNAPDAALWNELRKTTWIDMARTYFVCSGRLQPAVDRLQPVPTDIIDDATIPVGFYRDEGHVVRTRGIQSFAAGYIAHELNTNGIR